MPDSMYRYSSEYHVLFDVLNAFHKATDRTEFKALMLLPNPAPTFNVERLLSASRLRRTPNGRSIRTPASGSFREAR